MEVTISTEQARGCGYRKPAKDGVGIYLVGDGLGAPCGLLPVPLGVCPCCGGGIKQTRGWTWITPQSLFTDAVLGPVAGIERDCDRSRRLKTLVAGSPRGARGCPDCPVGSPPPGRHGLLWIGEGFYPTPEDYIRESARQGVSRKIKAVPQGFVLGETWVFLAHRKAIRNPATGERDMPGIFSAFRPRGIDLVIADAHNVPEKAERLAEKIGDGARLVKVVRDVDAQTTIDARLDPATPVH